MRERRRYPRVPRAVKLQVQEGVAPIATSTVNISCGGVLCWLDYPLAPMTKVAITLALPKRRIECTGAVVRCEPAPAAAIRHRGRYRVAFFFLELARPDHRAIAEFVLQSMMRRANGHRRP